MPDREAPIILKVLFFAKSREIVGRAEQELALEAGSTTQQVVEALRREHPGLESVSMRAL